MLDLYSHLRICGLNDQIFGMQTIWGLVNIFQMKNEANGVIYSLLTFQLIEDSHFPPNLSKARLILHFLLLCLQGLRA